MSVENKKAYINTHRRLSMATTSNATMPTTSRAAANTVEFPMITAAAVATSTVPTTSQQTQFRYDYYALRRSRSNSPNSSLDLLDLAYLDLEECFSSLEKALADNEHASHNITNILLNNNLLSSLPVNLTAFQNIQVLDISSNRFEMLDESLLKLTSLKVFIAKDNLLEDKSIPKRFADALINLESINLSGNLLTQFPYQLLDIPSLREIYLGSNKISTLPRTFENLFRLEILYLGGNQLRTIPEEVCQLRNLSSLNLSNNRITTLPNKIAKLRRIKNLALHGNDLTTLPVELVKLNLHELSLRNNPLVTRFAREYTYNVPSLLELCGRSIKIQRVPYVKSLLPKHLVNYLNSAQCCLNPKCKGVYFTSKVEHIKFVDFCGKYRIPLMQYLCSSQCNEKIASNARLLSESSAVSESSSDIDGDYDDMKLKKILLG